MSVPTVRQGLNIFLLQVCGCNLLYQWWGVAIYAAYFIYLHGKCDSDGSDEIVNIVTFGLQNIHPKYLYLFLAPCYNCHLPVHYTQHSQTCSQLLLTCSGVRLC